MITQELTGVENDLIQAIRRFHIASAAKLEADSEYTGALNWLNKCKAAAEIHEGSEL